MRRKSTATLSLIGAAVTLVAGFPLVGVSVVSALAADSAAPAAASAPLKRALMGVWVGPFSGYENNWHRKGFERITITAVHDASAKGTWQFKDRASDPWTSREPLRLVALPSPMGGWIITGADHNGLYDGTLNARGNALDLSYQSSGARMMAYHFDLTKRHRGRG